MNAEAILKQNKMQRQNINQSDSKYQSRFEGGIGPTSLISESEEDQAY